MARNVTRKRKPARRKATAARKSPPARKSSAPGTRGARRPAARTKRVSAATKGRAAKKVSPVPKGYHTLNAHLWVKEAERALDFYREALGAQVRAVMRGPGGRGVMHAALRVGDSTIMLADEWPGMHERAPQTAGATTAALYVYVPNADALFARAVKAGAEVMMPVADMFWGDRMGKLKDPFGHVWSVATRKEELSEAEIGRRSAAYFASLKQ